MTNDTESPHQIWIDCVDEDTPSIQWFGPVPRIGENVGARHPEGMEDTNVFVLEFVVDVRHYPGEIRVMVSGKR